MTITLEPIDVPEQIRAFPHVLSPTGACTRDQFLDYVKQRREELIELMKEHGALAFRACPLQSPDDFQAFLDALEMDVFPYVGA